MNLYWAAAFGTALLAACLAVKRARELGAALQVSEETRRSPADPGSSSATQTIERQTQQARKMEAIGRLAGGIAHDFNNLLTAITGYTELVAANLALTDPMIQDVYEIRRAALSAGRLTKQLLALSSHQRMHTEVLDVNAVVARTADTLRRTLGEKIDVTLALDPEIKAVKADAEQMEQIVLNLAANARDAMPNGGHMTLTTNMHTYGAESAAIAPAGDYVRLTIADTGCGMSEETQLSVFEPFFTTKGTGGTGLGLATVYGIVAQSHGHVAIQSTVGVGTTFTIDLPATSEPLVAGEAVEEPRFVDGYATVLIVEDDPRVRRLIEIVLRRAGHDVVSVAGPRDALAALNSQSDFNLVLTDIVMPEMNGYDLATEVRKIVPRTRVVFMSGFACDAVRQPIADPFLAKPFTIESLTNAVQQALKGSA
jgi:two-component system, cell cycle sensor histidine kinase and response regulator CckA